VSGTITDSMDGILDKVHEAGLTLKAGCGIGYEFSHAAPARRVRVAGAGAYTSGPMSFMDIYDKMCFTVSSAGGRRGAQMGTFDVGIRTSRTSSAPSAKTAACASSTSRC
jgi:ribonucleoside-diphosphate reductase alpha chain